MSVETKTLNVKYLDAVLEMALENYNMEKTKVDSLKELDKSFFSDRLYKLLSEGIGSIAIENGDIVGYLIFHVDTEHQYAVSPIYGYGINHIKRGEIISRLFQDTATILGEQYCKDLCVNVYAHDIEVLKTYIMSAFVMDTTNVIRNTEQAINTNNITEYTFREIDKAELLDYKEDVIGFYRNLINHLRESPIFYPCNEFLPIEERFSDFLANDIRVFAVFDKAKLIGMVISEPSDIAIAANDKYALNLSDLFIAPDYRRNNIGTALLAFANNELRRSGVQRLYVTHGTINPTARGFWDKYFQNYSFSMTRQINPEMLGKIQKV